MTYTLDTSGFVQRWVPPHGDRQGYDGPSRIAWTDLDAFTQGYVEALFESDLDNDGDPEVPAGLTLVGLRKGFSDLALETLARIIADCERRMKGRHGTKFANNRYGRFFWDRVSIGELAGEGYPPLTVQLGDDGKVRFA